MSDVSARLPSDQQSGQRPHTLHRQVQARLPKFRVIAKISAGPWPGARVQEQHNTILEPMFKKNLG